MKILLTTIAAVLLVGCGESQPPEPTTVKTPDISIHEAVAEGNIESVKQHLAAGTDVNAKDKGGGTPLHIATISDHTEAAELLIAESADVNAKTTSGYTPLHYAAGNSHKGIVELLIEKGAVVDAMIEGGHYKGHTPLDMAIRLKQTETTAILRKHGGKTGEELKAEGK